MNRVFKSFLLSIALPLACMAGTQADVGLPPTTPLTSPTTSGLTVQYSNTGLSSVNWNGTEMLALGTPTIQWIGLVQSPGNWVGGDTNPTVAMDGTNHVLTQTYAWGTIRYAYTTTQTQLFADVTIRNTSSTAVGMFIMELAQIKFPSTPLEYDGSTPMLGWNTGDPTVVTTSFGSSMLAVTNEDPTLPLMVGWPWPLNQPANTIFPLRVLTGRDSQYSTSYPFIDRQIPAGSSMEFKIGFRFGPKGTSKYDMASDLYQRYVQAFPYSLNWTDHRPIAELFLTNPNCQSATNPRCWFNDAAVDVTKPAGVAAFQARLLAFADSSIAVCKAMNAQAAITWDIEGQQFPQPTTYIGDPRLIPTLAPEISGVVDAYFKKFIDAGLQVGMTIRPQQLILTNSNTQASQQDLDDPTAIMIQKISYAHSRWGANVFYVDSNGPVDNPTDPKFLRAVIAAVPGILLIPEHSNLGYYSFCAPYGQMNWGALGTPADVRQIYPQAFRVFTIADGDVAGNMATLVDSVRHGDVLFFRGWFNSGENPQVTNIYNQAATPAQ